jgi:hypothetical protein
VVVTQKENIPAEATKRATLPTANIIVNFNVKSSNNLWKFERARS